MLVLEGTPVVGNNYFPAEKHNLLPSNGFAYGNQKIARSRQFCWSVPCLNVIEGQYALFSFRRATTHRLNSCVYSIGQC